MGCGFLKANGWKIIINSDEDVARLMYQYNQLSKEFLKNFEDYEPNTIVIWEGLYKFESYLKEGNRKDAPKKRSN